MIYNCPKKKSCKKDNQVSRKYREEFNENFEIQDAACYAVVIYYQTKERGFSNLNSNGHCNDPNRTLSYSHL